MHALFVTAHIERKGTDDPLAPGCSRRYRRLTTCQGDKG